MCVVCAVTARGFHVQYMHCMQLLIREQPFVLEVDPKSDPTVRAASERMFMLLHVCYAQVATMGAGRMIFRGVHTILLERYTQIFPKGAHV